MAATKLSLESKADGSGIVIATQTLRLADVVTLYLIGRDSAGVFVANEVADAWSLKSVTDGVVSGDLVPALDGKSAVFTAALDGSCIVDAACAAVSATSASSGILYIIANTIVSLSDVQVYTKINNATDIPWLIAQIKQATATIENRMNQPVYPRVVEEILSGSGTARLYMQKGRIRSLVGSDSSTRLGNLQWRGSVNNAWQNLVTNEDLIYIDLVNDWCLELLDYSFFWEGIRNFRVKYNCGCSDNILQELNEIALQMIQMSWNESKMGGDMLGKSETIVNAGGGMLRNNLQSQDPEWQKVFDRYKRIGQ